jgi:hypothetical protein
MLLAPALAFGGWCGSTYSVHTGALLAQRAGIHVHGPCSRTWV